MARLRADQLPGGRAKEDLASWSISSQKRLFRDFDLFCIMLHHDECLKIIKDYEFTLAKVRNNRCNTSLSRRTLQMLGWEFQAQQVNLHQTKLTNKIARLLPNKLFLDIKLLWRESQVLKSHRDFFVTNLDLAAPKYYHPHISKEHSLLSSGTHPAQKCRRGIVARQNCMRTIKHKLLSLGQEDVKSYIRLMQQLEEDTAKLAEHIQLASKGYKFYEQKRNLMGQDTLLFRLFKDLLNYRKLTLFVVQSIREWQNYINESKADRRLFRIQPVYTQGDQSYLIKLLNDSCDIQQTVLANFLQLSKHNDPFIVNPVVSYLHSVNTQPAVRVLVNLMDMLPLELRRIMTCLDFIVEHCDKIEQAREKLVQPKTNKSSDSLSQKTLSNRSLSRGRFVSDSFQRRFKEIALHQSAFKISSKESPPSKQYLVQAYKHKKLLLQKRLLIQRQTRVRPESQQSRKSSSLPRIAPPASRFRSDQLRLVFFQSEKQQLKELTQFLYASSSFVRLKTFSDSQALLHAMNNSVRLLSVKLVQLGKHMGAVLLAYSKQQKGGCLRLLHLQADPQIPLIQTLGKVFQEIWSFSYSSIQIPYNRTQVLQQKGLLKLFDTLIVASKIIGVSYHEWADRIQLHNPLLSRPTQYLQIAQFLLTTNTKIDKNYSIELESDPHFSIVHSLNIQAIPSQAFARLLKINSDSVSIDMILRLPYRIKYCQSLKRLSLVLEVEGELKLFQSPDCRAVLLPTTDPKINLILGKCDPLSTGSSVHRICQRIILAKQTMQFRYFNRIFVEQFNKESQLVSTGRITKSSIAFSHSHSGRFKTGLKVKGTEEGDLAFEKPFLVGMQFERKIILAWMII